MEFDVRPKVERLVLFLPEAELLLRHGKRNNDQYLFLRHGVPLH